MLLPAGRRGRLGGIHWAVLCLRVPAASWNPRGTQDAVAVGK